MRQNSHQSDTTRQTCTQTWHKQERKSNSKWLNADRTTPKGQLLGTPQWSHQFYYGEKFLWIGVPQQTALTLEINISQFAIEIKCLIVKDQTSYLIPDGWSRSPLSFPIFSLNCYNTSSTTSKQYKHIIFHIEEKFLWLGVPQQTARLQKSIFPNMQ